MVQPNKTIFAHLTAKLTEQAVFVQKLTAENPTPAAIYGFSVSISSGLLAVGSPGVS